MVIYIDIIYFGNITSAHMYMYACQVVLQLSFMLVSDIMGATSSLGAVFVEQLVVHSSNQNRKCWLTACSKHYDINSVPLGSKLEM